MKTLQILVISVFLAIILFPFNTILAQNQTQPTIRFDQASYFTKNMSCDFYNTGKISVPDQSKATIIVTDSNANKFGTSIDRVVVFVWSDSDRKGIEITAYETEVNSGIFEGKITISEGQSTQDIIHVSNGDTLSARYASATSEFAVSKDSGITTTSFIGMSCPPLERVPASSIRILDTKGNQHNVTTVGKQVLIVSDISNPTPVNQNFTYIVQIQDKNGSTVSLAWLSGTMLSKQTSSPSVSWTPNKVGNYVVQIFVWQSLTNPNALSPPLSTDFTVLHDFAIYPKSPISNVDNLHCQLGFELMTKPTDGSPVCVTPNTAQKLVERGWTALENSGVFTLENQTYYFGIPIYTNDAYIHSVQISFHNVLFTLFPSGFRGGLPVGGCPGQYYWTDVKFADDAHELLHVFAGSQSCSDSIPIMLSNHIEPQAGLTFYDGKLRLLVKVENQGKDIVLQKPSSMVTPFPRCNPNPAMEKLIREKQQILTDALLAEEKKYGGFENRTQNLPWSAIGYDCVDNALEVGILPQFFNSDSLPKYFEKIRSIVGNTIDIVLSPEEYATPV